MESKTEIPQAEPKGEKSVVVISRKWHEPKIGAYVNNEEVGVYIMLDDFVKAMASEMGSPALVFTKASLEAKMLAASRSVQESMKEHSNYAVS